jgi:hypothetical protein
MYFECLISNIYVLKNNLKGLYLFETLSGALKY